MLQFNLILEAAITPIVLISGVGLLLLSLTNRYNHAINRTRQLNLEILKSQSDDSNNLSAQQQTLFKRCKILKRSIGFIVFAIFLNSILVLINIASALFNVALDILGVLILVASIVCIIASSFLLFLDVSLSLRALHLELERIQS